MAESGETVGASLWDVFSKVPDPRDASGRRFALQGMLALTVAALLAGRQGLCAIARWGRGCSKRQLARLGVNRPKSPCHATYHNVLVTVKDNQPSLREAIDNAFAPASSPLGGAKARGGNRQCQQCGESTRTY